MIEDEILKNILVNMPNFIGFGLMAIVLYRQNNKLIDLLGDELKFWRERSNTLAHIVKSDSPTVKNG